MFKENEKNWEKAFQKFSKNIHLAKVLGEYNIEKYLNNEDKKKKTLDFGCGNGRFLTNLKYKNYKNLFAYDVTDNLYKKDGGGGITFIYDPEKNLKNLEKFFPFDIIIVSGVLHHLEFPFQTIEKIMTLQKSSKLKIICIEPTKTILRSLCEKMLLDMKFGKFFFKSTTECLINEYPTYKPWTNISVDTIILNLKNIGFKKIFIKKTLFNVEFVAIN